MNYSKRHNTRKINNSTSKKKKYINKLIVTFFKTLFVSFLVLCILGISLAFGVIKGIIDNTPKINIESIAPLGFATTVYDSKGNVTDTLVMAGANREEASYEEIPKDLINAFVAIEDERFWQHKGIDTKSIMRAVYGVLKHSNLGGGSTITQQLIKNNVFNGGRESSFGAKLERKLQEQYLALELEKTMDKKQIITNYLNTINLGNNALGVKVASRRYFGKEVSELTLSEATVLAGITQNPSKYNPISGREKNEEKRKVILSYMLAQGYITKEDMDKALADNVYDRIQNVNTVTKETPVNIYSYFTDELTEQVMSTLMNKLGYSETQSYNLLYGGGLSIYTTLDPDLQQIVEEEVNNPDNYDITKYSAEYRLSVEHINSGIQHYSEKDIMQYHKNVLQDDFDGLYKSEEAAKDDVEKYKAYVVKEGDRVIGESFSPILQPQASFVLMDQKTGQVKALIGGRGPKNASLTLNRASNTLRQPGSTFKVISAFAPAIDAKGATLATTYYDEEYTVGKKTISNWYSSRGYLGYSNIREGIIYSMNIVAARCLMETVTPRLGVEYCKNFGITTLTDNDYSASVALGGLYNGVSNLELTAAYATIANGGMYTEPIFFTKIVDHNGKVLIDNTPATRRVIKESTAFLLTDAMRESMISNRKFARSSVSVNSTSTKAHLDNMSCAGKSGTTSKSNDIWFVGYTPYYTGGIWSGFDENQKLGEESSGTSYHKVIWKKIMTRVHDIKQLQNVEFTKPADIETATICRKSGKLPISGVCSSDPRGNATYTEYFAKGTVPTEKCDVHSSIRVCSESGQRPTAFCPSTRSKTIMKLPDSDSTTDDSYFAYPRKCSIHTGAPAPEPSESDASDINSPPSPSTNSPAGYGPGYAN